MTTDFVLRESITINNDDDVDLNAGIECSKNKEQYLSYNGITINIPHHHIVGHIEFYSELQHSSDANSSLDAEKSAFQFVSRYDF